MGSSFLSPPAKRTMPEPYPNPNPIPSSSSSSPFSSAFANGQSSNKRSKHPAPPMPVPAGHVSFRLLCHDSRIGGIIGKSGSIIKQLQQQTGAKIRIEEAPPGCSDRVITIVAPNVVASRGSSEGRELLADVSRGQEALVRVFERVLEVAAESGGVGLANVVSCRMLAEVSHVGSVIGKGGKVVEKIRRDCGVKIRVLTDNLPACASSSEEVIEIEGDVLAVKKALIAVSECLQECQLVDKTRLATSNFIPVEATVSQVPVPEMHANIHAQHNSVIPTTPCTSIGSYQKSSSASYPSRPHPLLLETDRVPTLETTTLQQEVVFRILCSNDRVGGVIGKGGSIIKALQNETGASISIGASMPDCDDRLITVTASENPESRYSAAQKTVVLVFSRSVEAAIERGLDVGSNSGYPVTARLVVSTNQVGCLMGKGGSIISEIRKVTGAGIRILGKDQGPKCVPENDQVVQISGDLMNVKDAIYQCTGRLRDNHFSSTINTPDTRHTSLISNETSPYARMNDLLSDPLRDTLHDPLRDTLRDPLRDTLRDPLRDALRDPLRDSYRDPLKDTYRDPLKDTYRDPLKDTYRDPLRDTLREQLNPASMSVHSSVGVPQNVSRHAIVMQSMDHHGLSHTFDLPPPRLWASQAMAGTNPRVIPDVSRGLAFKGNLELGSGSKAAIVTNTTVEIIVPESVIGSVYGQNGNNLARLRQISGAKVIVHEPRLGSTDRIVVISGTPDETQAAQSLLQAFILTG